jgi:hypothetical protein
MHSLKSSTRYLRLSRYSVPLEDLVGDVLNVHAPGPPIFEFQHQAHIEMGQGGQYTGKLDLSKLIVRRFTLSSARTESPSPWYEMPVPEDVSPSCDTGPSAGGSCKAHRHLHVEQLWRGGVSRFL